MQIDTMRNLFHILLITGLSVLMTGCGGSSERLDRRDERDPLIIRGDARKRAGDIDGAIELYQKALDRKPGLALAHLKLAVEFDEQKQDYLRAIYHYQRYLELRPRAQKNELVKELIRMAHVSYLASLPNPPPGAIERIAMLERENERLKYQVDDLARRLREGDTRTAAARPGDAPRANAAPPRQEPAARPAASVRPQPAPDPADATTYRVQRGDTLSRIAAIVYNDSRKWHKIYDANRDILSSPESIREGQTLKIPSP